MKKITVFTPTFNRANLLPKLYESLCAQTSQDFLWLIIDDGSSDGTHELVKQWQSENRIEIDYKYKENGGMHTGHNLAYELIKTELNVCIDSDDYMPDNGVHIILDELHHLNDISLAGLIFLDADADGKIIGTQIPDSLQRGSLKELYVKHNVSGDKKVVLKTEVVKKYARYPEFKNERLVPLGILYLMIGFDYDFLYINKVLCIVDYQAEGSSGTILNQYRKSPRGFLYARNIQKKYSYSLLEDMKHSAHIVSSSIFANQIGEILKGEKAYLNVLMIPIGVLVNIYIRLKTK